MLTYLAIDQYGNKLLLKTKHPRKELLDYHGTSRASKMYIDTKEGEPRHIGYVIEKHWYRLYKITPFTGR